MKQKYIAPEFKDLDLLSPTIMGIDGTNGARAGIDFTDESHVIDVEDPFGDK